MKLRVVGFVLTILAVVVLVGSLVAGLGDSPPPEEVVDLGVPRTPFAGQQRIRVEVLNGAGVPGLARDITRKLRGEGFDVVFYGNAGRSDRDSTVVVDRIGNPEAAEAVAHALGINRIETVLDTTLYLEATVLLGRDLGP